MLMESNCPVEKFPDGCDGASWSKNLRDNGPPGERSETTALVRKGSYTELKLQFVHTFH